MVETSPVRSETGISIGKRSRGPEDPNHRARLFIETKDFDAIRSLKNGKKQMKYTSKTKIQIHTQAKMKILQFKPFTLAVSRV